VAVSFHSIHDHGFRVRAPIFFFSVPCTLMRAHFADDFVEPVRRQRRGMGPRLGARTYTRWLDTGVEDPRTRRAGSVRSSGAAEESTTPRVQRTRSSRRAKTLVPNCDARPPFLVAVFTPGFSGQRVPTARPAQWFPLVQRDECVCMIICVFIVLKKTRLSVV
jgi:hypothetical protein